jgi:hypothetical protein
MKKLIISEDSAVYFDGENEHKVELIDDWGGFDETILVIGNEFGFTHVITGRTESDAYEAYLDECETIPESELWEAYGFESSKEFDDAFESEKGDRDLADGYQYQSNSSGTGIVSVGIYETWAVFRGKIVKTEIELVPA